MQFIYSIFVVIFLFFELVYCVDLALSCLSSFILQTSYAPIVDKSYFDIIHYAYILFFFKLNIDILVLNKYKAYSSSLKLQQMPVRFMNTEFALPLFYAVKAA